MVIPENDSEPHSVRHGAIYTLWFSSIVAIVAALVVSSAAVLLNPKIDHNREAFREQQLESIIGAVPALEALLASSDIDAMEKPWIDLATGCELTATETPLPADELELPGDQSSAGLRSRAKVRQIFRFSNAGRLALVVLPVEGVGYQSTIKAYLALLGDLNTVAAFTVIEQGETPGLGARISEQEWQARWQDRQLFDAAGELQLRVSRKSGDGPFEVDGITGATRTGDGINDMLSFWLGDLGYRRYLQRLSTQDDCP